MLRSGPRPLTRKGGNSMVAMVRVEEGEAELVDGDLEHFSSNMLATVI